MKSNVLESPLEGVQMASGEKPPVIIATPCPQSGEASALRRLTRARSTTKPCTLAAEASFRPEEYQVLSCWSLQVSLSS